MGSAMVRALLASGRRVAAWNRTLARAEALAGDGAVVARTAAEALTAAPLVILCVSATEDARAVLDAVDPTQLAGRTVLNMTSGTPEDARLLNDWAASNGVPYLDASIGAYPEQLGSEDARIMVAGDQTLFDAHRDVILEIAGSSLYVGAEPGAANAVDAALTGAFYIPSLVCFIEAARFVHELDIPQEVLVDLSRYSISVLEHQTQLALGRIASGDFSTQEATLDVYADAAATFATALETQGAAPMTRTAAQVLRRAVDAGLGDQDITAAVSLRD